MPIPESVERERAAFKVQLENLDRSPKTVVGYQGDHLEFLAFCPKESKDVNRGDIAAWIGDMRGRRNLGPRSIRRHIASVSAFFKFLVYSEVLLRNPCDGVIKPKISDKKKIVANKEQAAAMVDLPCKTAQDRLDALCLEILYATGGRLGDLADAKIANLNLQEGTLFVIGKGKKPATLLLTRSCLAALWEYVLFDRPKVESEYLLLSARAGKAYGTQYGANRIYRSVIRTATKAGLYQKGWSTHSWRRSFATIMKNEGMDLMDIRDAMRHSNIATTNTYLIGNDETVKLKHRQFHPRA